MTPFVMLAALLAVVAIAIVVWPLWKTARPLALALMLLLPLAGGAYVVTCLEVLCPCFQVCA